MPHHYSIEIFQHPSAIETAWRQLDLCGCGTAFQRYQWCAAWYDGVSQHGLATPCIVGIFDAQHRLCMVLPLIVQEKNGIKTLCYADLGVSDFNAPLLAHDFTPDKTTMRRLWTQICAQVPAHDLVYFERMPAKLGKIDPNRFKIWVSPPKGRRAARGFGGVSPNTSLAKSIDNPLVQLSGIGLDAMSRVGTPLNAVTHPDVRAYFTQSLREKMVARARKLGKRADVSFDVAQNETIAVQYLDILAQGLALRRSTPGFNDVLAMPHWRHLYSNSLRAPHPLGRIAALSIEGEVVAIGYGLVHAQHFYLLLHTFTGSKWRNYSPGLQLITRMMQWAQDEGLTYFDFTIGAEGYKMDFGVEEQPLYQCVQASTMRGSWCALKAHLRAKVRQYPMLRRQIKRLLSF